MISPHQKNYAIKFILKKRLRNGQLNLIDKTTIFVYDINMLFLILFWQRRGGEIGIHACLRSTCLRV